MVVHVVIIKMLFRLILEHGKAMSPKMIYAGILEDKYDFKAGSFEIQKIKAHQDSTAVSENDKKHVIGNHFADQAAAKGLALCDIDDEVYEPVGNTICIIKTVLILTAAIWKLFPPTRAVVEKKRKAPTHSFMDGSKFTKFVVQKANKKFQHMKTTPTPAIKTVFLAEKGHEIRCFLCSHATVLLQCTRCQATGTDMVKKLNEICPGVPSAWGERVKKSIMAGRRPHKKTITISKRISEAEARVFMNIGTAASSFSTA